MPEQIVNMDETSLSKKRMPERTFIHREAETMPGFKVCVSTLHDVRTTTKAPNALTPWVVRISKMKYTRNCGQLEQEQRVLKSVWPDICRATNEAYTANLLTEISSVTFLNVYYGQGPAGGGGYTISKTIGITSKF